MIYAIPLPVLPHPLVSRSSWSGSCSVIPLPDHKRYASLYDDSLRFAAEGVSSVLGLCASRSG